MENNLSQKIIMLRLKTRLATMCETKQGKKKNTLSLESKILFLLLDGEKAALDIETQLSLRKANLVLLSNKLLKDGLITKTKSRADQRRITLALTQKGQEHVKALLSTIEEGCKKAFPALEDYETALNKLDEALSTLEFI